ncbi:hypothetical protein E1B28_000232 [Marasmius oreades]|uniref:Zn(2)-C6 fungal-type domain-containing protein n=1 Tax=Marasmius oreades TaxID=181124 RepID=A0A9P7V134_9AGAR|nr:uncharacterized protein E1B28_000232 [Marasmius oreades]KAG7098270.1 hypothetical protein E1B28_000232 [Marasmius oreades]
MSQSDTTEEYSGRTSLGCCPVLRADLVHDGASGQQRLAYYWQLQYYNDVQDVSELINLPSSFAQTVQEENDVFYATFPSAKPPLDVSGMVLGVISENGYHDGLGFFPPGCDIAGAEKSDLPIHTVGVGALKLGKPEHAAGWSNACSTVTINTLTRSPIEQIDVSPDRHSSHWDNDSASDMTPSSPYSSNADGPTSTGDDFEVSDSEAHGCEAEADYHSQGLEGHPHHSRLSTPLHMGASATPSTTSPRGEGGGSVQDLDLRPSQATGTWPSLKVRRNGSVSLSLSANAGGGDSSIHTSLTTYGRRSTTLPAPSSNQNSGSITPASSSQDPSATSSSNLMPLSPLPSHRRPIEKKKTQTLACNFCRGRKIACGPPLPGTVEKTCNQCQRRSLKCVFPTESRRGVRKKKLSAAPNGTDMDTVSASQPLDSQGPGTLEGEG